MSALSLHHIKKTWGDYLALNDISFTVEPGNFVALLGPSGCGKTTLLRTIAGLESADEGQIQLQQQDVTHLPPSQRKLSMVFQSYALFPHLNVRENLLFGLKARGEDKQTFGARLHDVSSLLELDNLLERLPSQLSGGQQQRVALGRAVIANHRLCLMDEPLSNLDARLRQSMRRDIRALQKKLGLTLIYVTHDQTEAMSMADSIILLNAGKIEQIGTPEALYHQPASLFAAQFIGAPPMNILPLQARGENHYLSTLAAPVVTYPCAESLSLGLRAEDIDVTAPTSSALVARAISYEYMGADTLLACQLPAMTAPLIVKVPGLQRFNEGESVGLQWSAARQYLFSSRSGQRCAAAEQRLTDNEKKYAV
ncbi:ABC transporter ATP-binding protein [Pantoea eucrina]|uniref:ABC transporter ATP-binding protein n=1 Tax=Pantoea eucrina TaxID=472693 RepID=A0ABU5LEQ7_9GAMM|nr:ABC transporter ATP-binding protein [Pantoea eucrina]MDZ7278437.1 ABC transporter ATP-binding protein [Pantoea eucrina]